MSGRSESDAMRENNKKLITGVPLRTVIILNFIVSLVVSILLVRIMVHSVGSYNEMRAATREYMDCQTSIYKMKDTISELSERAQNFVVTGTIEEVILFFNEIQVQNTQGRTLEEVKSHDIGEQAVRQLDNVIKLSERLLELQMHAMRLTAETTGEPLDSYPKLLQNVVLPPEEQRMSNEEKQLLAKNLVFDKNYSNMKGQINTRIDLCRVLLQDMMEERHNISSDKLQSDMERQRMFITLMMVLMLLTVLFTLFFVVQPLYRLVSSISRGENVDTRGSSEIRFLAHTYNRIRNEMDVVNAKLGYDASHDALTGLYNRSAYDEMRQTSKDRDIALIIVDVDLFKEINDTYGHDVGDKVLVRVANVMQGAFREADKVCRIGGDEFSIIMVNADSGMIDVLKKKIKRAAGVLSTPTDSVPAVTISVGVAFSDQMKKGEDLFKNADRALYQIKENGRNGCGFYVS